MPLLLWRIPEDLRVGPDGAWRTGGLPVLHAASLRYLKARLVFEEEGAFVVDGGRRMPVQVEGPAYEVLALVLDAMQGSAEVLLDDGSRERVTDASLSMNDATGRLECAVRGGRARAVFSRAAHQTMLDALEEQQGRFVLRVGLREIPIRV